MRPLLAAIQFLTILPLPIACGERDIGRSSPWFPVAGALVGLFAAGVWLGAHWLALPPFLSAAFAALALAVASGGLHLDGWADSCDGLLSHRSKERVLEIMRDSRIGAMGAMGLFFLLSVKITALGAMSSAEGFKALLLAPILSRAGMSICVSFFPYARPEGGLAAAFIGHRRPFDAVAAAFLGLAGAWLCLEWRGLLLAASCWAVGVLFSLFCLRKIGGVTGDTLGAVSELLEAAALVGVVALLASAGKS